VFDSAQHSLRPVLGSLGAGFVGASLDAGMPLLLAQISATGDYALATNQTSGQLFILKSLTGRIAAVPVTAPARPDLIQLSPRGLAAVLNYESSQMLLVITGLPDNPTVARSVSYQPSGFTAFDSLETIAVSDDGQAMALTVRPISPAFASSQKTFYLESGGVRRRSPDASAVTAVAFFEGSHEFVLADLKRNALLRGSTDAPDVPLTELTDDQVPGESIVGLGVTTPDALIHAAKSNGAVLVWNPRDGQHTLPATCSCTPSGMFKMPGSGRFLLNSLPAESLWVYEGGAAPRLVFLPVADTPRLAGKSVTRAFEGAER
jgi:hypothetical protein